MSKAVSRTISRTVSRTMPKLPMIGELIAWMSRLEHLAIVLIVSVFIGSSVGVIYSAHMTRALYSSMQSLQSKQDDLESEYEKLLLEQSAWAGYTRVDQIAREELGMTAPAAENLVVVRRPELAFESGMSP
ncbi:MAG: cell division protein FtsL [Pseudomonadales bacterium]